MRLSRRVSAFLFLVGIWNWVIWPTFARNVAKDPRSFDHGSPTGFLIVHLVLTAASLVIGTAVGVVGWRGWRAGRKPTAGLTTPPA
jgi:hypothetical protein